MHLRERNYPPNYWLNLHHHIQPVSPFESLKKHRKPTPKRIETCLLHLYPFIQKIIYSGAIDRKKGHVRSSKTPITPEQFNLIKNTRWFFSIWWKPVDWENLEGPIWFSTQRLSSWCWKNPVLGAETKGRGANKKSSSFPTFFDLNKNNQN